MTVSYKYNPLSTVASLWMISPKGTKAVKCLSQLPSPTLSTFYGQTLNVKGQLAVFCV